jgi:hypothetical protein
MLEYLARDVEKVKPNFNNTAYNCIHFHIKWNSLTFLVDTGGPQDLP